MLVQGKSFFGDRGFLASIQVAVTASFTPSVRNFYHHSFAEISLRVTFCIKTMMMVTLICNKEI